MEIDQSFKMIIIGPPGVGKSCLLNRYTRNQYKQGYNPTLGVQFFSKTISIDDNTTVKIQIWDTAGQQSFRSIIKTFYRSSNVVFLVYSIASLYSFEELQHWYVQAVQNCSTDTIFALIGTQKDRELLQRNVPIQRAEQFMKDKDMTFMYQTSAKTSQNVQLAFTEAAKSIVLKKISQNLQKNNLNSPNTPKQNCKC